MIGARGVFVGTGLGGYRLFFLGYLYVVGGIGCVCDVCGEMDWKAISSLMAFPKTFF